ncbi:bifunctional 3-(3-hydroxy-phenyl)propionate/3-hydroxycinnamic acid hydroxylase [Bradyrhizobium sp. Ec3.3]|uniref:bifunctional 3-(3-hydroxy-phenyl)propionate/3-hydroxycinnamic acid hydroxylase MhpA n=1 Tax=Bradyrhizobium sp. Ec3.3 TaxID=189753 RepID=UPI0007C4E239|nr:bifunctional 3-(3-hydroxy-phenyl)propionate/3-hydroxycinnamic acid hydroxylase [Bradyrhizobium sp. Ec3.3]
MSEIVDVAVVGLGPVGAVLSALLGRQGISTIVLDKADDIFALPRAISFDHEVMRIVQNLGLAEDVHPYVVAYPRTEYRGVGGKLIACYESLPPPYPQGWQPGFMFKQPPFERALRQALAEIRCVDIQLGTALENLTQHGDHVELAILDRGGERQKLRARYVVGCDGGGSLVRKLIGGALESLDFDEPWLVVDVLVNESGVAKLPQGIVQYCDPQRPTTYVVGSGNHRRWEFMLLPGETAEEMNREETIWRLLGRWMTPEDGELWRAATYVFHALVANEWRRDRVLLAGDAAHMTPPFMAQGMCQGIRDAANLAWKLELVLRERSTAALLDSYQHERRPHVRTTTETAKMLGRIICELDPEKAAQRDAQMLSEKGDPPAVQYRQSLIPGLVHGALCSEQGPPVGARFPQPRIASEFGITLLDDQFGNSFRLIMAPSADLHHIPVELCQKLGAIEGKILCLAEGERSCQRGPGAWTIVETDGLLGAWMRDHKLIAALVRPDHYVFAIARQVSDLDAMSASLDLHFSASEAPLATTAMA